MTTPIDSLYRLLPRDRQLIPWGPIFREVEDQQAATLVRAGGNINANELARFHIPTGYHIFVTRIRALARPGVALFVEAMIVDIVDEVGNLLMGIENLEGVPLAANVTGILDFNVNDIPLTDKESFLQVTASFNLATQVNVVKLGYAGIAIPRGNSARFF